MPDVVNSGVHLAGVSVAVLDAGRVLLVERGREPFAGLWSLPGGKIEPGESPAHAIHRELKEETGLRAELIGIAGQLRVPTARATAGPVSAYELTVFAAIPRGGELRPGSDCCDARWVALEDLDGVPLTDGAEGFILEAERQVAAVFGRRGPT